MISSVSQEHILCCWSTTRSPSSSNTTRSVTLMDFAKLSGFDSDVSWEIQRAWTKKRNSKNQELLSSFIVYLHRLVTEATSSFTFWTCNSATANAIGATDYGAADNGATDRAKDAREIRWPGGRQRNQHGATALNNSGNGAQVVFKPRLPLGIFVSDVQAGRVSGVLDGQAKEQGLEAWGGTGSRCGDDSACRCP